MDKLRRLVTGMAIGTKVANTNVITKATLTPAFSGNSYVLQGLQNEPRVSFGIYYMPKTGQTNRKMYVKFEWSPDGTNFYPLCVPITSTTNTGVYQDGADGATAISASDGIPYIIPGDQTSAGGTQENATIKIEQDMEALRVSVREDGSADFGAASVEFCLSSLI
jgi:hypothetical protein